MLKSTGWSMAVTSSQISGFSIIKESELTRVIQVRCIFVILKAFFMKQLNQEMLTFHQQ